MDFEKAILNPGSEFACPEDVLNQQKISREQKIKILRRWEYDARELEVAEEENMGGGPPSVLSDILVALHRLGSEVDPEFSPPTKQG